MITFTVLGADGFIGSHLVKHLRDRGFDCWAPGREENLLGHRLHHVVYCIGLTADYRHRPYDTVRAHVCILMDLLEKADFDSLLYLSSTRIYRHKKMAREDESIQVNPLDESDIYNISKLMGESLCVASKRPNVRIARLSNVFGGDFTADNFLSYLIRDALHIGKLTVNESKLSERDFVHVDDVTALLAQINLSGKERIYNVASGVNTTNATLLQLIERSVGSAVEWVAEGPNVIFPPISIDRTRREFGYRPQLLEDALPDMIAAYRTRSAIL